MPLNQGVFGYPDGSVLVALIAPKLLVNPRMSVSREAQPTLRFPLFNGPNQTFNAVLAGIREVFFVLDDLAYLAHKSKVVADHSLKALIFLDAVSPAVVQQNHFVVRQQTLRCLTQSPERLPNNAWSYLQVCILEPIQRMTGTAIEFPIAL